MAYIWIKTFHIVFVIAWMAAVFYLPRILLNIVEAGDAPAVRERLLLMGRRLQRRWRAGGVAGGGGDQATLTARPM